MLLSKLAYRQCGLFNLNFLLLCFFPVGVGVSYLHITSRDHKRFLEQNQMGQKYVLIETSGSIIIITLIRDKGESRI